MFKQTLCESFKGIIWKLIPDNEQKYIAIESRDVENKKVHFSVLDYETGEMLINELSIEEPWYAALAHICRNYLIITGFEYAGSPVSKGITAINIDTKAISWQKYHLSLYDTWQQGLRVFNPNISPRKFEWLDLQTGESTNISQPDKINLDIMMPSFNADNRIPDSINQKNIVGDTLSLKHHDLTILSFHEQFDDYLRLRLLIIKNETILLDDILTDRIQKQQLETFFIQQNQLFYIKNSHQIVSYNLV